MTQRFSLGRTRGRTRCEGHLAAAEGPATRPCVRAQDAAPPSAPISRGLRLTVTRKVTISTQLPSLSEGASDLGRSAVTLSFILVTKVSCDETRPFCPSAAHARERSLPGAAPVCRCRAGPDAPPRAGSSRVPVQPLLSCDRDPRTGPRPRRATRHIRAEDDPAARLGPETRIPGDLHV